MENIGKHIGEQIRAARIAANLTQKELAELADCATITIQQYERGVREPKLATLQRIAFALGTNLTSLTRRVNLDIYPADETFPFWDERSTLLNAFARLNQRGKTIAIERIIELSKIEDYTKADGE